MAEIVDVKLTQDQAGRMQGPLELDLTALFNIMMQASMEILQEAVEAGATPDEAINMVEDMFTDQGTTPEQVEKSLNAYYMERLYLINQPQGGVLGDDIQGQIEDLNPELIEKDEQNPPDLSNLAPQDPNQTIEGFIDYQGLGITVENRQGSTRSGTDPDGNEWSIEMKFPYGYIRLTDGTDGDEVDVYVGPEMDSPFVYVIHQLDPDTGEYDEDKVMLGFSDPDDAKEAYLAHYDRPGFFGTMDVLSIEEFKRQIEQMRGEAITREENMPLPTPTPGESQDDFVSRCMSAQDGEDKPQDQKLAICFDKFREVKKSQAIGNIFKAAQGLSMVRKEAGIDGTTSVEESHYHMYATDENGAGATGVTLPMSVNPHIHKIENWNVGTEEGHTHSIQDSDG